MAITPSTTNKKKNTETAAANTGIVTPSLGAGGVSSIINAAISGSTNHPSTSVPTTADRILSDTGVASPITGMTAVTGANIGVNTAPKPTAPTTWHEITELAKPAVVPSGPSGEIMGWKDLTVTGPGHTATTPGTPSVGSSAQNTLPVTPPKQDDTSKDDISKDDGNGDSEGDDTGSGTTPPPEDVVASIIAAASSSNGMTDTVLNNWLELIGTGVEKSGNLSQMIQDALAGATVADTGGPALESALGAIGNALAGHDAQDRRIDDAMGLLQLYGSDNDDKLIQDFRDILGANMAKSDAYSNAIYGNADFMKNTGLDLMEYMKGYNPLNTDWGRGVLDYYGIQSVDASNNANAAGAADNGGNIDSYAAANAERQRLSTLGQGINAISGMTNDRFSNLLNTFNSIGVNVNNLLGLEGQYNLPFMTDQLKEAGSLASTLYQTDADAAKAYNDDVLGLVDAGNTNSANRGTVASTASGLAGTMAQANVDAQKDNNDFISSLINAEGALNLPALINLINGAGSVGSGLYATDAQTTANLYNYLASMYGGGVESSGTENTGSTLPVGNDVIDYVSSAISNGLISRDDLSKSGGVEAFADEMIKTYPAYANSRGFLIDIIKRFINSGNGGATASAAGVNTATS